ncbi:F-box protein [Dorcoceras hygrometricum]|uniref:F-box protein n=1 Tax=Dorcoceras hygrometricum TaxID=472368 RepID=A0A2Z7CEV7_9LAMI|nr:F-box protein [Dorcoceras hygrometricum]
MLTSSLLITASSNRNADVIIADSRFLFASTSDSFTFAQQLINIIWTASELHLHAPAGPDINVLSDFTSQRLIRLHFGFHQQLIHEHLSACSWFIIPLALQLVLIVPAGPDAPTASS